MARRLKRVGGRGGDGSTPPEDRWPSLTSGQEATVISARSAVAEGNEDEGGFLGDPFELGG